MPFWKRTLFEPRWQTLFDFALVMAASTLLVETFLLLLGSGQRWH
jgi:hypothetical protein